MEAEKRMESNKKSDNNRDKKKTTRKEVTSTNASPFSQNQSIFENIIKTKQ